MSTDIDVGSDPIPARPPFDAPFDSGYKLTWWGHIWEFLFGSRPRGYHSGIDVIRSLINGSGPSGGDVHYGLDAGSAAARQMNLDYTAHRSLWQMTSWFARDVVLVLSHLRWSVIIRIYEGLKALAWYLYETGKALTWRLYETGKALTWRLYEAGKALTWRLYEANKALTWALYEVGKALTWRLYETGKTLTWRLYETGKALTWTLYEDGKRLSWDLYETNKALTVDLHRQAEADLARTSQNDRAYAGQQARTAEQDAIRTVDAGVIAATSATWPILLHEITGLSGQLGHDFAGVAQLLGRVPADAPGTAPAAVATAAAALPPILRTLTDCVIPQCRDLGGARQLAHVLSSLGFDALLVAFLVFIVTHPQEAAADTAAVGDPITSGVAAGLRDLLRAA